MHSDTASFREFVFAATGTSKDSELADKAGIVRSTFYSAVKKDSAISAEMVIQVSAAFGLSILDGLRAAGYIGDEEVELSARGAAIETAPDSTLLSHLTHRAIEREHQEAPAVDELARKRAEKTARDEPFTAPDDLDTDYYNDGDGEEPLPYASTEDDGHKLDNVRGEDDT